MGHRTCRLPRCLGFKRKSLLLILLSTVFKARPRVGLSPSRIFGFTLSPHQLLSATTGFGFTLSHFVQAGLLCKLVGILFGFAWYHCLRGGQHSLGSPDAPRLDPPQMACGWTRILGTGGGGGDNKPWPASVSMGTRAGAWK